MSRSERVYRLLLLVYPREFTRHYGEPMVQSFGDLCREEKRRGRASGLMKLWLRTVLDLAATAFVERRHAGHGHAEMEDVVSNYKLAGVGVALLLAPLYFVCASLLKYDLGIGFLFDPMEAFLSHDGRRYVFNLVSSVLFLGGVVLAVVLNIYSMARLNLGHEEGALVGTVRVEIKVANLAVAALSILVLVVLAGYVFLENFAPRF